MGSDTRLPDPPGWRDERAAAADHQSPRWSLASRLLGFQSGDSVSGQPRVRGVADELPGSTGFGRAFWEASFRAVGIGHAGRHHGRCHLGDRAGDRRPPAGSDLWRELRRLRRALRHDQDTGPVSLRHQLRGRLQPVHLDRGISALLEDLPRDDSRDGRPPGARRGTIRATSPLFNADRIEAPLFVAQGANDPRVTKEESDQIVEALRRRGVEVQYMVKEDEGHGFHNEENRFEFYRAMETFLNRHLEPQPQ